MTEALELLPPHVFADDADLEVWAFVPGKFPDDSISPEGKYTSLGSTRGFFGRQRKVDVPASIVWGVRAPFELGLSAVNKHRIPGFDVGPGEKPFGDDEAARLAACSWLRDVTLPWGSAITDRGLEAFSKLTQLRSLGLGGSFKVTDAGLDHLARLPGLVHLDLSFERDEAFASEPPPPPPLTNAALARLAPLQKLKVLELRGAWVTGEGLQHLAKLEGLEVLSLYDLDKGESSTTEDERDAFKKARPRCETIEW